MSFSGRLHHIALRGCLAALIIASSYSAPSIAQPKDQPDAALQQQQSASKEAQPGEPGSPPAAKEPNAAKVADPSEVAKDDKPKTAKYRSPCGDTDDDRQADLCEQQRMSSAAESAAYYAFLQLIFGAIGLVFVVASLLFAGIGAFAARDAAKVGTDAARIARNAERPYIVPTNPRLIRSFSSATDDEFPRNLAVHFGLSNIGRGLGTILGYGINHELCLMTAHGGAQLLTRDGFGGFVLSSGSQWESEAGFHVFQITEAEFNEIATTETKSLYVYGYIRYVDLFNIVRRTSFSYDAWLDNAGNFGDLTVEITNRALWYDREEPDSHKS